VKDSTATSCLPAVAEFFPALYIRNEETSVPEVSRGLSLSGGESG